jgi:hypothetical protein
VSFDHGELIGGRRRNQHRILEERCATPHAVKSACAKRGIWDTCGTELG